MLAYRRLLGQLSLDPALAQSTADYMLRSLRDASGPDGWPLQLVSVDDLARIPGYDARVIEAIAPFVTILPDLTVVNANTAAEPVLIAAIPRLSPSHATSGSSTGARRPISSAPATSPNTCCRRRAATRTLPDGSAVGVNSGYFLVHCRVHSARINTRIDTLIARYGSGNFAWTSVIWVRRLMS